MPPNGPNYDSGFKLFVGNLPSDVTQEELNLVFSTYGEVSRVHLMNPHHTSGDRCALVFYVQQEAAEDAIKVLNGIYKIREHAENPIKVSWAKNAGGPPGRGGGGSMDWSDDASMHRAAPAPAPVTPVMATGDGEGFKLFVGGLPTDVTQDELHLVFSTYGEVRKVHLMPPQTGSRAAAFIFYAKAESGEDAIKVLDGIYKIRQDAEHPIQVRWARDKGAPKGGGKGGSSWSGSDWGGGGGGGGGGWNSGGGGAGGGSGGGSPRDSWEDGGPKKDPDGFKVFVGGLPFDCTQDELQSVFSTYGHVNRIHLMPAQNPSSRSAAFVFYATQEAAEDSIKVLDGIYKIRVDAERAITVRWAKDSKSAPSGGGKGGSEWGSWGGGSGGSGSGGWGEDRREPEGFKLFVGGLPPDCTSEELQLVFGTYGQVTKVHLMSPHAVTGRVAGFVFYQTADAAEDAIKVLNGIYKIRENADQPIQVRWADNKAAKGGGKGGDAWGGGGSWGGGGKGQGSSGMQALPSWQEGAWNSSGGWQDKSSGWQDNQWGGGWQEKGGGDWQSWGSDGKGKGGGKGSRELSDTTLFVGNLPEEVQEDALQYVFGNYGKVQKIHIMTGKSRSGQASAFVEFASAEDAETAIVTLNEKYEIRPGYGPILVKKAHAHGRSRPY